MCVRFSPLTLSEARSVLDSRLSAGRARFAPERGDDPVFDAHPGSQVPVYTAGRDGLLHTELLTWGFDLEGKRYRVFNTRLESALDQLAGRRGMWARAIEKGRCLVPVRCFYEGHRTESVESPRTGKPVRRQYRFRMVGSGAFLIAGIQQGGRFSIVTVGPNATVAEVHDRMPLVLGRGESALWIDGDFSALADRSGIALASSPADQM